MTTPQPEPLRKGLVSPLSDRAVLSEAERTMLVYALDQAQERVWSEDGFTDEDQAALDSLRRLAAETHASEPESPDAERSEEEVVREHVTTLHLLGEQLATVENWMWQHLANVRDAGKGSTPGGPR